MSFESRSNGSGVAIVSRAGSPGTISNPFPAKCSPNALRRGAGAWHIEQETPYFRANGGMAQAVWTAPSSMASAPAAIVTLGIIDRYLLTTNGLPGGAAGRPAWHSFAGYDRGPEARPERNGAVHRRRPMSPAASSGRPFRARASRFLVGLRCRGRETPRSAPDRR